MHSSQTQDSKTQKEDAVNSTVAVATRRGPERPPERRVNILLVDDQAANLMALAATLEPLEQTLVPAQSGAEALRRVLERDFAVILMDVQMPDMDGFEAAETIRTRERSRHTPIIFLTAYEQTELQMFKGYSLGAVDYLIKPIVPEVLRSKVAVFVRLRQMAEEIQHQADLLRENERKDHERLLAEERQRWEIERLRAEAEREKRLSQQLAEADGRKDEFLAMLGHELRNPLAPIMNTLHVLRRHCPDANAQTSMYELMERQVRHMARLVDDLLDVSRITTGKIQLRKERLELAGIVRRAVESTRPLMEGRHHHFQSKLPDKPIWLEADATRLEQILGNLLNNAAKYTEEGGRINLSAEVEAPNVIIRVRDSGIGIGPEVLPRIFDLFIQADRSLDRAQGGLGIGLT
ncbi:MAG TPA: hybrid sensor histidine kinase/response regulator, partial [Gemmataceae bacterium]|nr:hybrid sensor histidine kinase/response regulator [Gemmataceae bacterium]